VTVVALITDFGLDDTYVAEMKAALFRLGPPQMRLLDVTHAIRPGDVAAGRWALQRIWPQLPAGTVHLAVVDPGVGTSRPAVAARTDGRWYVGPGNGLGAFLAAAPDVAVWRLELPSPPPGFQASSTFHGRDLFAPAAAHLASGGDPAHIATPGRCDDLGAAARTDTAWRVVWVDRFGNLITDLRRDTAAARRLEAGASLTVAGRRVRGPVRAYAEAARGELIWYWGSGDTLEIALDSENAAARLGVGPGLAIALDRS
jgi:hypothetical protein